MCLSLSPCPRPSPSLFYLSVHTCGCRPLLCLSLCLCVFLSLARSVQQFCLWSSSSAHAERKSPPRRIPCVKTRWIPNFNALAHVETSQFPPYLIPLLFCRSRRSWWARRSTRSASGSGPDSWSVHLTSGVRLNHFRSQKYILSSRQSCHHEAPGSKKSPDLKKEKSQLSHRNSPCMKNSVTADPCPNAKRFQ